MDSQLQELIALATLAPSGHNTQPWKFQTDGNLITILPDYGRRLPVVDPDNHALFISLGCALENLLIASHRFGYEPAVDYHFSSTQDAISVKLAPGPAQKSELFDAIKKRQSTRSKYSGEAIPAEHLKLLAKASEQEGVLCRVVVDREEIRKITALVKEGSIRQFNNRYFKEELIRWIRFNEQAAQSSKDGLYAACMGNPSVPKWLGELILKYTTTAGGEAEKAAKMVESSSALLVFAAKENSKEAWVKLGQSFERVALQATALGIRHAHHNMPCEEVAVREKLKKQLGYSTEEPLLLIRIGYSDALPYSYRRPVKAVMSTG